jgi:hypothetical protein
MPSSETSRAGVLKGATIVNATSRPKDDREVPEAPEDDAASILALTSR